MSSTRLVAPLLASLTLSACYEDSCVAAGSLVDTPEGRRPIEALEVGDLVLCVDPQTGERHAARIVKIRSQRRPCISLGVPGEERLFLTHDHPVYSPAHQSYGDARHWVHGEVRDLLKVDADGVYPVPAEHLSREEEPHEVFDLTVDHELHNFVANGVLVHNKSYDPTGPEPETSSEAGSESTDGGDGDAGDGDGDADAGDGDGDANYSEPGPHPVGNRHDTLTYGPDDRTIELEYWYPAVPEAADTAAAGQPIEDFLTDPDEASTFAALVDEAPLECTSRLTRSALDAPIEESDTELPLVMFSHCHNCTRFSTFTLAERLASHGFVVVGVAHTDNRLFDQLDGTAVDLGGEFLATRAADISAALDYVLDPPETKLPHPLEGRIDPNAVGMYGHSFGAATTGLVLETDERVIAGAAVAAPVESPLLPGVTLANISQPMLFLLATEDNSITEIGNNILRNNFADLQAPAWKIELADAGHWSFTDICQVVEEFQPGCGEGERQTVPGETFTYLDIATARDISADALVAFFAYQLVGDDAALAQLEAEHPSGAASLEMHD